ncbi:MAG: acetyltransferase [Hyphomonadaceae bacterium]|nr:acetyltransferase [Hyphomonadaceae bacterium]
MPATVLPGLYLLGSGGHARSVADVALSLGITRLIFVDSNAEARSNMSGFTAIAELPRELEPGYKVMPAVGSASVRERLCASVSPDMLATLIAPNATIGFGATIGAATFVGHHAHIGPCAQIADGVIVNTGAIIEHDCRIGSYSHVSVNSTIAGGCRIGNRTFVGAGSVVIDGIEIADNVTIGAGATVIASIHLAGTYVGTPARRRSDAPSG